MPLQCYEVLAKLGSGKYASVYRIKRIEDSKEFALKRVPLDNLNAKSRSNSLNQAKLLKKIKHPNIINLEQVCFDEYNGHLCLILELATEDLSVRIKQEKGPLKQQLIWSILSQISGGLEYLHSQNILHRDIKTTNMLLLPDNIIKIGDLNVSTTLDKLNYTRTGTLSYASPQICKGQTYDSKSDIWSFGCLVYEMVTKKRPFDGENIEDISKKIVKCQYAKIQQNYSKELKDLISFMIQLNPRLRPSAKTIHRICQNKIKGISDQNRTKRLKSLTPFLQRQRTQNFLRQNPSCTQNTRTIQNGKKGKLMGHILRKSINTRQIQLPKTEQPPKTSLLKSPTHLYKRMVIYRPQKHNTNQNLDQIQQNIQEVSRKIKFVPKRLNKLTCQQNSRRHTQF